jgi:hypothetical protein
LCVLTEVKMSHVNSSPGASMRGYRAALGRFNVKAAPALLLPAVAHLLALAEKQTSLGTQEMAVVKDAKKVASGSGALGKARAEALVSAHEMAKFVSGSARDRASNRSLPVHLRNQAIRVFGPLMNQSVEVTSQVLQKAAAEAATLAPVAPARLAREIKSKQVLLRNLDKTLSRTRDAKRRAQLNQLRKEHLRSAAALVTAAKVRQIHDSKRFLPFDVKSVPPTQVKSRIAVVLKKLRKVEAEITVVSKKMGSVKPGPIRTMLFNRRAKLLAERAGLRRRLVLLRQGKDKFQLKRVRVKEQRTKIQLPPGLKFRPSPDLVTVMVRYLAQRIPRRPGESRRHFIMRLRMYVLRALARFAANSAGEPDAAAAIEAAAVATVVEDSKALEAEVDAGGVADDQAAEAMGELAEAYNDQLEQAATDFAPETAESSTPDEFVSPDTVVSDSSPETIDDDLEEAFETMDVAAFRADEIEGASDAFRADEIEGASDARPWYKNPVVWGGAALAAVLIIRR